MGPLVQVKVFLADTQIDSDLLDNGDLLFWSVLYDHYHFFIRVGFSQIEKDKSLIFPEHKHERSLFLVLERPTHKEAFRKVSWNLNIIEKL